MAFSRMEHFEYGRAGNRERMPLIRSLIAAVKEQGASMDDLDYAYQTARALLKGRLQREALTKFCDEIEASFRELEKKPRDHDNVLRYAATGESVNLADDF